MPHLKKCIYVEDLLTVTLLSCMGVLFVLIPPFNENFLRIPFALSLFFFVPGYAYIAAFFPGKKDVSIMERFTLSVGFSVILTVFSGFLISITPWGYRPAPIVISILGMTTFFSIIAIYTRKLLDENEQFSFSVKEFIRSIQSDEFEENIIESKEIHTVIEKRRFHRSKSKVKAEGLKYHPDVSQKKPSRSPEIERVLIISFVASILISGGMLAYAKMTYKEETFTVLYLLGPDGKAEGYPTQSYINVPLNIMVGIENHEHQDINYVLQMKADEDVIEELNISIKDGGVWQKNMTYNRQKIKYGISKLEFSLFKERTDEVPYRSVHFNIENYNSLSNVDKEKYTEVPAIENGDMESATSWNFSSDNESITGSYVNGSGLDSSHAYRIVNSYKGNLSHLPEYGEISQNIQCKGDTMIILSAYVKGDLNASYRKTENQMKLISVNGETVWKDNINENEDWQHVQIPITLQTGINNLTLGLIQTPGRISPVEVLWDSVSLKSLTDISYIPENGNVETISNSSPLEIMPQNSSSIKVQYNKHAEVKLDVSPNPFKNATNLTVTSSIPLRSVVCLVNAAGFESDSVELNSTDKIKWMGSYVIKHDGHFYLKAMCTDIFGNTTSVFDEITADKSLPNFEIEVNPKTIDVGDLKIKVIPLNALEKQPSVYISNYQNFNVTYVSYIDGVYYYKAKIGSDIGKGEHKVIISGYDLNSVKVEENTTFIVDHSSLVE